MAGKPVDLSKFTAFQGTQDTLFKITQSAAPELFALANQFPLAFDKALKSLGHYVQKRLKETVKQEGPASDKWLGLSKMRAYRRMEKLKKGELHKPQGRAGRDAALKSWPGPREETVFGTVAQAIAYRKPNGKNMVEIGALSPSAAKFLAAVQGGQRGAKSSFAFTGRQAVTPKMRRAMWAAGIPLSKHTAYIGQHARPLVLPVFKDLLPEFESFLVGRITAKVLGVKS